MRAAILYTVTSFVLLASSGLAGATTSVQTPTYLPKSFGIALSGEGDAATVMAECDIIGFACAGVAAFTAELCGEASGLLYLSFLPAGAGHVEVCTELYAASAASVLFVLVNPVATSVDRCRETFGGPAQEACEDLEQSVLVPVATGTGRAWAVGYKAAGSVLLQDEDYHPMNGCIESKALTLKTCGAAATGAAGEYECVKTFAEAQSTSQGFATSLQEADGVSSVVKCAKFDVAPAVQKPADSEQRLTVGDLAPAEQAKFLSQAAELTDSILLDGCPEAERGPSVCGTKHEMARLIKESFEPSTWTIKLQDQTFS